MATGAGSLATGPYEQAVAVVRENDRDRYLTTLFAPEAVRPHLSALYAFNAEIARIRDVVSDPALGEIRLQWWRDAIADDVGGGHPIAMALLETIRKYALPREAFARMLDARIFDLYDDAMPTLNDLEGYAGDTTSALFQMASIVLAGGRDPGTADAAGHAGVAYAIMVLLRQLPRNLARNQSILPRSMLETRGIDPAEIAAGEASPRVAGLLRDVRTIARQHLGEAQRAVAPLDPEIKVAFLPLALVAPYLDRMDAADAKPLAPVELSPWRRQWILWRASRAA